LNSNQDIKQREATQAIIDNNFNGELLIAMRVGKTKIIIDALHKFHGSVLWITSKAKLRDEDIPAEFYKWYGGIREDTEIICYRSTGSINKVYDLIILDEYQHVTLRDYNNLKGKFKNLLACSGTKPNKYDKLKIYNDLGLKVIYELPLEEAIDLNIVADFEVEIWKTELNNKDKNVKVEYLDRKVKPPIKKVFYTTELERYKYISRSIAEFKEVGKDSFFLNLRRLKYLGLLKSKEDIVHEFLVNNQDKKVLVFCVDILQAERITPLSYHSKTDDACLKAFLDDDITHLSVCNMVDDGRTFPHIDIILIIGSNSSNVQIIQRIGRSLMYKKDFKAKVIALCAENTIEETWLNRALSGINPDKIIFKKYER